MTENHNTLKNSDAFPYRLRIDTFRKFSIVRFPYDPHIFNVLCNYSPETLKDGFLSLTRTPKEISIIQNAKYPCYPEEFDEDLAKKVKVEEGFVMIEVVPLVGEQIDFSKNDNILTTIDRVAVTGLLAKLASILAKQEVAIFAMSTFDTDYILIKDNDLQAAVDGFVEESIQYSVEFEH
jgi:hypothetical protein